MTGGEALAEMLIRNGVETLFGLPGVQLDGLFNAFWARQDRLRVIHTRHEQATAYMADGYARVSGREGVCVVVPGPGLLNAAAAISTAYACNSPVLCVTGQIRSDLIDHGRGMLHEIRDQVGMIRHITKSSERAMEPTDIPGVVDRAFCGAAHRQDSPGRDRGAARHALCRDESNADGADGRASAGRTRWRPTRGSGSSPRRIETTVDLRGRWRASGQGMGRTAAGS